MRHRMLVAFGCCALALASCAPTYNEVALKIGAPPKEALNLRSFEVHRFDDVSDEALLPAVAAAMQDLGFTITETATDVGVLAASKKRDATESGQVAGQVALTVMFALLGTAYNPTWDALQDIHVTVVSSPAGATNARDVRVSFDRYITNNHGQLWKTELVTEPKIYTEFFQKLEAALKLEKA